MTPRRHTHSKVQALREAGVSIRQISKDLNLSRNTVRLWCRRGDGDIEDRERSGRPRKLSPVSKDKIRSQMKDKVTSGVRKMATILNVSRRYQGKDKSISHMTVSRHLRRQEWGKVAYRQPTKPLLSAKNVTDRFAFCNRLMSEGFCDDTSDARIKCSHVLFTDESPVELHPKPNKQNRRVRTANPEEIEPIQVPKFSLKIMVAGGIGRYGKTRLHVVDKKATVNGDYYRERILPMYRECAQEIFPMPESTILMQDGATCHTARASINKCNELFANVWVDWPGNSPDLNPLEHLWSRLQQSVLRVPRPRNRDQLITRVQEEWDSITQLELSDLVLSFPRRLQACLDNSGSYTKY